MSMRFLNRGQRHLINKAMAIDIAAVMTPPGPREQKCGLQDGPIYTFAPAAMLQKQRVLIAVVVHHA